MEIRRWIVFTRLCWGLSSRSSFFVLLHDTFSCSQGVLCRFAAVKPYLICFTRKQDVISCICICMEAGFLLTADSNESPLDLARDLNCADPPTPPHPLFFLPSQLALVSFRAVQIWYWSLDIRHTVRELADTQRHSVPVLSLLQIPLHVGSLPGSSCNRSSNWSHLRRRQIHTVVSFQLYPSAFTSFRNISIPLAKSFSLATHLVYSATSNLISLSLSFFLFNCYSNVFCQVLVWIGRNFYWWVRTNR